MTRFGSNFNRCGHHSRSTLEFLLGLNLSCKFAGHISGASTMAQNLLLKMAAAT